ncbi:hypothetical protein E3Q10_03718 [Wallemia mellicola]|uniref:DUF1308 domain-containing protein n=1 Tax=Wallemia mellicola TaxID=1708541 RepID=A0A4T0QMU3_9BASI|nr:hypothetical protein E3Q19_00359 [Wallemia mellicola]TIC09090.1 hypothetical protein E3Q15_03690 [Wallemia mellicola]TIC25591.1 hypothetical protein E3Q10_03718 [Wallemia mellicola]TIC28700.1 hypothetical protein E3Q11_01753 [Wallemia mellicola]TIC59555.1 hypothetical protein E3Q05_00184 [Wallemia mellicola]
MLVIDDWIDATNDWKCSGIEGYQRWRSLIKSEMDATEELSKTADADDVLQASNLIAHSSTFKALINPDVSKHPITAVNKYFLLPKVKGQKGKPKSVKVDVVADAGRSWIRLSSLKMSSILAELAEMDSLLTSSEDEHLLYDHAFTTPMLLKLGHELSEASLRHYIHDQRPDIHLYFTRLTEEEIKHSDPRISAQIEALVSYGINVHYGIPDYTLETRPCKPKEPLRPTSNINLDVSILIAFISLTTHIEDPATASLKPDPSNEHIRAISNQLQQESGLCPLIDLIKKRCDGQQLQFWTTEENKDRTFNILEKIGGESEKRRLESLFEDGQGLFWVGSRHCEQPITGFPVKVIRGSCDHVVNATFDDFVLRRAKKALDLDDYAGSASKLTPHTLRTVIAGLERGWTTLTSNRQSIRALVQGWHTHVNSDDSKATFWLVEPRSLSEQMLERSQR